MSELKQKQKKDMLQAIFDYTGKKRALMISSKDQRL
jgi:hypothetical protein